jgi:hypothetical protein
VPGWSTRADVVATLRKRWATFLTAFATGEEWSPLSVPLRTPKSRELAADFDAVRLWAQAWRQAANLRVEHEVVGGRLVGANSLPSRVWIDGYDQLWALLGVGADVRRFTGMLARTGKVAPAIAEWMVGHPLTVLAIDEARWDKIVATVLWIDTRADATMYLRQVDVPGVDTKFIEANRAILVPLLDIQLPAERVDTTRPPAEFAARYRLRLKPRYVRYRWLDADRSTAGFSELSVRVDELAAVAVSTVFVLENETTYLALPPVPDSIAVFGGGYSLTRLRGLTWLAQRRLVYWGDLDTHGFAILDRLRQDFPHAESMLMDRATLLAHEDQWVREDKPVTTPLDHLTAGEHALYVDLVEDTFGRSVRLEQERVGYSAIERAMRG